MQKWSPNEEMKEPKCELIVAWGWLKSDVALAQHVFR
jgi:hypothetical protein